MRSQLMAQFNEAFTLCQFLTIELSPPLCFAFKRKLEVELLSLPVAVQHDHVRFGTRLVNHRATLLSWDKAMWCGKQPPAQSSDPAIPKATFVSRKQTSSAGAALIAWSKTWAFPAVGHVFLWYSPIMAQLIRALFFPSTPYFYTAHGGDVAFCSAADVKSASDSRCPTRCSFHHLCVLGI